MLISDKDAEDKLNSPHNLLNRMREGRSLSHSRSKAMSLFGMGSTNQTPVKQEEEQHAAPFQFKPNLPLVAKNIPEVVIPPNSSEEEEDNPSIDDIMSNADSRIKMETAHNEALETMVDSIKAIRSALPAETKPAKLADIAAKMSRIVGSIRSERIASQRQDGDRHVHLHLYSPQQKSIDQFETIDVNVEKAS